MRAFRTIRLAGIAASLVLSTVARVEAVPISILNHSFESPDAMGGFVNGVPPDWIGVAGDGDLYTWVEADAAINLGVTGGDGFQHGGMEEDGGYIYQDVGVPFQADKTYRLDLASYHRAGTNHSTLQFGLFSSNAIGTDIGTPGFMDIQGVWTGSGNPDADDMFDTLRDASELQKIDLNGDGIEALGHVYQFDTGPTPPAGNIVVFIRHQGNGSRIQYDNIRLDELATLHKGDVDSDGDVDLNDVTPIRTNFRTSATGRSLGDLDDDGFVDFTDFLEWKANYPFPAAGALVGGSVPEPSSAMLGLFAGLVTLCGGRKMRRERSKNLAAQASRWK